MVKLAKASDESASLARSCVAAPTLRPALAPRVQACRELLAELERDVRHLAPEEREEVRAMIGTAKLDSDFSERESNVISTRLMRELERAALIR